MCFRKRCPHMFPIRCSTKNHGFPAVPWEKPMIFLRRAAIHSPLRQWLLRCWGGWPSTPTCCRRGSQDGIPPKRCPLVISHSEGTSPINYPFSTAKSQFSMGKSPINGPFSSSLCQTTRRQGLLGWHLRLPHIVGDSEDRSAAKEVEEGAAPLTLWVIPSGNQTWLVGKWDHRNPWLSK